jgi:ribonuclease HI
VQSVTLTAYGACVGNPGPGGWAYVLRFGPHTLPDSGGDTDATATQMGILAVVKGLEALKQPCNVQLWINNDHVRDSLRARLHGWTRRRSEMALSPEEQLLHRLRDLAQAHQIIWLDGIAWIQDEMRCDELVTANICQASVERAQQLRWRPAGPISSIQDIY